jgi:hypothetical protein
VIPERSLPQNGQKAHFPFWKADEVPQDWKINLKITNPIANMINSPKRGKARNIFGPK